VIPVHQWTLRRRFEGASAFGWTDGGSVRFGGWRVNWPSNRSWWPSLFRLDHILAAATFDGQMAILRSG